MGVVAVITYTALQVANVELVEGLAGLVTVADILKGLGGVLATNVEDDLLTTTIVGAWSAMALPNRKTRGAEGGNRSQGETLWGIEEWECTYGCSSINLVQS